MTITDGLNEIIVALEVVLQLFRGANLTIMSSTVILS